MCEGSAGISGMTGISEENGQSAVEVEKGQAVPQEQKQESQRKQEAQPEQRADAVEPLSDRYRKPQKKDRRSPVSYSVLGAASALYALFYTFCLYRNASGITYPFFVAGTLFYLFFCMKRCRVPSGSRKDGGDLREEEPQQVFHQRGCREKTVIGFYIVSLVLLGISVCLTDDYKLHLMTKTGIFLLTVTLTLRCFYRTQGWSFEKYISAIGRSIAETLHYMDTPFSDAVLFVKEKDKTQKNKNLKYILLGIVTAVPALIVILALLLSADAVFYEMFKKLLGDINLGTVVLCCLMAAAVYVFSYSFVRGLFTYRMPPLQEKEKKGEPVAAITFTLLIAMIYLVFCAIQVVYLFAGKMQLPDGLTWASYARQGFFQLLFVCLINLVLVLFCLSFFKDSKALKILLTAISLMTYILIASSAYRMILYIQNYYLTFLRVFVLWSLAVIAVVFAGVIVAIYKAKFPLFGFCTVVVTIFYLCLAFAKPDYWIAEYDLAHAREIRTLGETTLRTDGYDDFWYFSYNLSADAAPVLLKKEAREIWGEERAFKSYSRRIRERTEDINLRNFNFSRQKARACMEGWYEEVQDSDS